MVKNLALIGCALVTFTMVAMDESKEIQKEAVIEKPPIVMLFGPPGSAQGVLAVKLTKTFSIPHVSPANLLVDQVHKSTELGMRARDIINSKRRVTNVLVMMMLEDRLKNIDVKRGVVLDEFPCTVEQVEQMKQIIGDRFRLVPILINVPDSTLLMQEEGRLVCQNCCRVYHRTLSPPEEPMTCDHCISTLTQLEEDTKESITRRLTEWHEKTDPLIAFFKKEHLLTEVNGNRSFNTTLSEIKQAYLDAIASSN
jgi:adenylate kinase